VRQIKGKSIAFIEACGPIPKGARGLCTEECLQTNTIRIWLIQSVFGVNEFAISRKHIGKIHIF